MESLENRRVKQKLTAVVAVATAAGGHVPVLKQGMLSNSKRHLYRFCGISLQTSPRKKYKSVCQKCHVKNAASFKRYHLHEQFYLFVYFASYFYFLIFLINLEFDFMCFFIHKK